jgi:hypothetical protein
MKLIPLLALAVLDIAAADAGTSTVTTPTSNDIAPQAAPETPTIRFLQIIGDMQLDAAERARLVEAQALEHARDAAADAKEDAQINELLANYAKANAIRRAQLRHQLRVQMHYNRAKLTNSLPIELLDRHDLVLVEDKARRELVTLADIRALDASNRFIARIAGTAAPDMAVKPGEQAELQRRYIADTSLRTTLTRAGPRHAMLVAAIEGLPAAKRKNFERVIREQVHSAADAADAARGTENAVILAEQRNAQRSRNSAVVADFKRWLYRRNRVTLEAARLNGVMKVLNTQNTYFPP